jgi:DNA-binding NtrC family response regulator
MLIVEDDTDGREILSELFRRHDWRVVAVATTDAALTELRERTFDLVISDEDLDGASGSAMLRTAAVEGLLADVCALMYTSQAEWLEVPDGVRVLHKPLAIGSLVDAVRSAVAAAALEEAPSSTPHATDALPISSRAGGVRSSARRPRAPPAEGRARLRSRREAAR